jgi:hypothetical protein
MGEQKWFTCNCLHGYDNNQEMDVATAVFKDHEAIVEVSLLADTKARGRGSALLDVQGVGGLREGVLSVGYLHDVASLLLSGAYPP